MRTLVFLAALSSFAFADTAKTQPGLAVTYTAVGKSDTTTSRLAALYVPKGAPATPFVPAGPFKAVFTGDIDSPLRADVTFFVKARGQVKVSINGAAALDDKTTEKSVQLSKGANRVVVEFTSDGTQDAQLQLDWASKEFPASPSRRPHGRTPPRPNNLKCAKGGCFSPHATAPPATTQATPCQRTGPECLNCFRPRPTSWMLVRASAPNG